MKCPHVLGMALLCVGLSGCESGPAHLDAPHINALGAGTIAVVYVDSPTPLGAMLSVVPAGEIPGYRAYKTFVSQLEPYQATANRLQVEDSVYAAVRKEVGGIAWLRNAMWTRVRKQDDTDSAEPFAEEANADVVVVLDTGAGILSYVEKVGVAVNAKIYTKPKPQSHRVVTYITSSIVGFGNLNSLGPDRGFGFPISTQPLPDAEVKARLDRVFAGDSAEFLRGLDQALGALDQRLTYFFTGNGPVPVSD